MGPTPTVDQKSKLKKVFYFRMGRVKAKYDNVRIVFKPKQETGDKEEKKILFKDEKGESEKRHTSYFRCNEAKE